MSATVPPSQSGATPSLFADCIWKTSLLPASINSGANPKLTVSDSVNGILYNFTDPEGQAAFIMMICLILFILIYFPMNVINKIEKYMMYLFIVFEVRNRETYR